MPGRETILGASPATRDPARRAAASLPPAAHVPFTTVPSDQSSPVPYPGERTSPGGTLRATCWGTRGSIPSPGPATTRFGGNTPCLEVLDPAGRRHIFDAGTGIRRLGNALAGAEGDLDLDLFLTHFHWDHIQGLPFFAPIHDPDTAIRIHGARQEGQDIETILRGQMSPVHFPVPYEALAARLRFEHLSGGTWSDHGTEVAAYRVRHPADTYGYRIRAGEASVAYVPDNELVGGAYPVDGPEWYPGFLRFLEGVDVLFHDAMFTEGEYPAVEGWGHSTFRQAVRLAEDAGVARLCFFHHAPDRTDGDLQRMVDGLRADLERRGSTLRVSAATEGESLVVGA